MDTSMPEKHVLNTVTSRQSSFSLLSYFMHPKLYRDLEVQYRAIILIAAYFGALAIIFITLLCLFVAPVSTSSRLLGVPIATFIAVVFFTLLLDLRRTGNYKRCSMALVILSLANISLSTIITGGITVSPVAQLLVLPPLMGYFFGGARSGNLTFLITTLIIGLIVWFEKHNLIISQTLKPEHLGIAESLTMMVVFSFVGTIAFVYEYISVTLREERDREHQKVVQLAQTDALTGLVNRRIFDDALAQRIARAITLSQQFTLCFLDLDGFKPINDRHGHDVGDQVLRTTSIRLRSALRKMDIVGRHGGDEFMLLLGELENDAVLNVMAQRFLQIIAEPIETSAGLVSVRGSFGFAKFPAHASDIESLKKAADAAMYEAKNRRCGWYIFDSQITGSTQRSAGIA
jgi:diguanylate cyclase (GGDEF)-like protein